MSPSEIFISEANTVLSFEQLQQKVLLEKHNCLEFSIEPRAFYNSKDSFWQCNTSTG